VYEKVNEFAPEFTPFTFHWYIGVNPSLTGCALNKTGVPWQTVSEGVEMVTDSDTLFSLSAVLTMARYCAGSVFSPNKGYWNGGSPTNSRIDALSFSAETVALLTTTGGLYGQGSGSSLTKGYWLGGNYTNGISAFAFSNETVYGIGQNVYQAMSYSIALNYWTGIK